MVWKEEETEFLNNASHLKHVSLKLHIYKIEGKSLKFLSYEGSYEQY